MQRLQNVFIVAAAKCQQCSGQGSARVRVGSDRVGSPYLWVVSTIAWPTRARHRATGPKWPAVLHAADPLNFGPIPTIAPEMVYD
jgi:hypothetical protein